MSEETSVQEAVSEVSEALEQTQNVEQEVSAEEISDDFEGGELNLDSEESDSSEQAELKRMIKTLTLKVDGEEIEEELPFEVPEEHEDYIRRQLQMAKVANKRMQQYSDIEKDAQDFFSQLKEDPLSVLGDESLGIDLEEVIEGYINRKLADSEKTPEQLELEAAQDELRRLKEEQEERENTWREQEMSRLEQQEMENYDIKMTEALENSSLPKSPYVVKKMADMLLFGLENGVELDPSDILPLVEEEIYGDVQEMFSIMPQDQVRDILGKDFLGALRQEDIQKVKNKKSPSTKLEDTGVTTEGKIGGTEIKKKTIKEMFGV